MTHLKLEFPAKHKKIQFNKFDTIAMLLPYSELPSLTVYPWVSRFSRWPPGLTVGVENLTGFH
jgi:hypothetical protein